MEQATEKLTLVGKISRLSRTKKIVLGIALVILGAYIALVIARIPHAIEQQKTAETVAKIHASKLTLDDVMGKNLPPDPGADADKTIEGIDANHNGIRDDVELAIFKLHPDSARIRAAELQYAKALQNELTTLFNSETWVAAVQRESASRSCVEDLKVDNKEVKNLILNTDLRKKKREEVFRSYSTSITLAAGRHCDIEPSSLPN